MTGVGDGHVGIDQSIAGEPACAMRGAVGVGPRDHMGGDQWEAGSKHMGGDQWEAGRVHVGFDQSIAGELVCAMRGVICVAAGVTRTLANGKGAIPKRKATERTNRLRASLAAICVVWYACHVGASQ